MIDFNSETMNDKQKFIDHFPLEGELSLQILKGHLLVEESMRSLFTTLLESPLALSGSRGTTFDCHQVICLVEAMTPQSQKTSWLWNGAKKLNNIRNDLSHQLTPNGLNDKIFDLIKYIKKKSPEVMQSTEGLIIPKNNDFLLVIMGMCVALSTLKVIIEHKNA